MPCYRPLTAYKRGGEVTFKKVRAHHGASYEKFELPCGQCIGCKITRTRMWAVRCMHEASLYPRNSFITLTYSDENLPDNGGLKKEHFQSFMKRLRWENRDVKIRYYMCGEYGEKLGRPHYHALIFNFDFPDKYFHRMRGKNRTYRSDQLERLWPLGFSDIGSVTPQSAQYVAGYIQKKISGNPAREHYQKLNKLTGEICDIEPEYNNMSRRPGIAKDWYDKYWGDVFPTDTIHMDGKRVIVPDYYLKQLEQHHPLGYSTIKTKRKEWAEMHTISRDTLAKREYAVTYNQQSNPRSKLK